MSGPWLASYVALWAVVLFQGALIFLLLRQLGQIYLGTAQGVSRDGLSEGTKAPDFTLPVLKGQDASLSDFRGLPLLLVFGTPSCAPCRGLIPDLNAFAQEQQDALRVLFLCRGAPEDARRFATENAVQVAVAVHPDESLADEYQVRVTPFAFVIDGEGVIRSKGLANNRQHLEMLLSGAKEKTDGGARASRNGAGPAEQATAEREQA